MPKLKSTALPADVAQPTKIAVGTATAARMLSVSTKTLHRLRCRGLLHPSAATRHLLWSVAELEAFINDTRAQH